MVIPRIDPTITPDSGFLQQLKDAVNAGVIVETDTVLFISEFAITKTNVGTTYVNLWNDYGGRPFLVDTAGYESIAVQIFWNKLTFVTSHDLRIVDDQTGTNVFYEKLNMVNGENLEVNAPIPAAFINFKGKLRIQVKAGNNQDDPIFSGIRIYLRR
jgi:hypothetical protein